MMTISDIYDALTASDRPYKPAVSSERALVILRDEAARGQLDNDLLEIFVAKRIFDVTAVR
jgi:HD-GYP domain-containing protein (c-di-GMP phosphodiesterase class II)